MDVQKRCTRCGETKPHAKFYRNRSNSDGLYRECKDCHRARINKYNAENPERRAAYRRTHYLKTVETHKQQCRRWRKENPDAVKVIGRRGDLKRIYSITPEIYDKLLTSQGGVCAICGKPKVNKNLAIDHDHSCCPGKKSCGKCIRGLLCLLCNRALAQFGDNLEGVLRAVKYLENPPKWGNSR